jgi:hypothetical protein
MKKTPISFILLIIFLLTGCVTTGVNYSKDNPNEFTAMGWNGGSVQTHGKKVNESQYFISVKGAGACSEEQIMEEANRVAKELAEGNKYETDFKVAPYQYGSSNGLLYFDHSALKVEGTVDILSE